VANTWSWKFFDGVIAKPDSGLMIEWRQMPGDPVRLSIERNLHFAVASRKFAPVLFNRTDRDGKKLSLRDGSRHGRSQDGLPFSNPKALIFARNVGREICRASHVFPRFQPQESRANRM
jgi:hypothetical protein